MLVHTDKITRHGLSLEDTIELEDSLLLEEDGYFLEKLQFHVLFSRDGRRIKARGVVTSSLSLRCVRCLEHFTFPVKSRFDIILFPIDRISETNASLDEEDTEYIFYRGDQIDVEKLLIEQVNLCIPFNPVCKADCLGICSICGTNLNGDQCQCEHPMSGLDQLFDKLKG